jgi:hypothetical protein
MNRFRLPSRVRRLAGARKAVIPITAFAAGIIVTPVVAYAATGSFSSSTTTAAVRASNTGGGFALDATSTKTTSIRSTSSGTGNGSALLLRQNSTGNESNGLYAKAYPTTGLHFGAWGVTNSEGAGVRGQSAKDTGILGEGVVGVFGQGSAWGLVSAGDSLVTGGNVYDDGGVSGLCTVPAGANSATCSFTLPLLDDTAKPIVVATPQGNPGGAYWVENATVSGFTLRLASAAPTAVPFGYHVIGLYTTAGAANSLSSSGVGSDVKAQRAKR